MENGQEISERPKQVKEELDRLEKATAETNSLLDAAGERLDWVLRSEPDVAEPDSKNADLVTLAHNIRAIRYVAEQNNAILSGYINRMEL
jgi:hypothetical protein